MANGDLILGIDLGTSACKALLADTNVRVLAIGSACCPTHQPRPGWAEQDPEEVWRCMLDAVREALQRAGVDRERIGAVSFSAAMHGLLPLNAAGRPLMRCLIWADRRSQPQAARLQSELDAHGVYLRTGCPVQPLYWPSKWLWLQEQQPEIARATRTLSTIKDYVLQRLLGRVVCDVSNASGTGLLNTHSLTWDEPLLEAVHVAPQQLPELVLPETVLGVPCPGSADELGLPRGVQVVAGGADGGLANLGAGCVRAGQAVTSLGTSGAVRAITARPCLDSQERSWCYALTRDLWFVGGAISNAGSVYSWLHDQLGLAGSAEEAFRQLDAWASQVPPGAEGLVFLPLLLGERSLGWRANARGVLFGLAAHHTRKHVVRAAIEGVALRLYTVLRVLEDLQGSVSDMRVTGGLATSPVWVKTVADVYGRQVGVPRVQESSALGAVFVALKALGRIRDYSEVEALASSERMQEPDPTNHELYLRLSEFSKRLYEQSLPLFDELQQLCGR